ncbi:hypothetical protein M405DRAFT_846680 [Rhizopogon salebrosus TDB-379]|nr:hypothetical protein M405DRAFT_846680 [Rhizopogon salebrosus TDB-379]
MPESARGSASPLTSVNPSVKSIDGGTLELGIKSAWARDNILVTGAEKTESLRAEPPTSGRSDLSSSDVNSTGFVTGALDAPVAASTPLISNENNELILSPLTFGDQSSIAMNISPLLGSIDEYTSNIAKSDETPNLRIYPDLENTPKSPSHSSWSDMPDDGDIGDIPEFPVLRPMEKPPSATSTPRIPAELKGKSVDPSERGKLLDTSVPKDWLDEWHLFDEGMAKMDRPGPDDPDESLRRIWDDDNRRLSIQMQNMYLRKYRNSAREQLDNQSELVVELRDRIQTLEKLVTDGLSRE